jgi:hypothetical protein
MLKQKLKELPIKKPTASPDVTSPAANTNLGDGIIFSDYSDEEWTQIALDIQRLMGSDPDNYKNIVKCAFINAPEKPFYAWAHKSNMRIPASRLKSVTALCDFTIPIKDKETVYECFFEPHCPVGAIPSDPKAPLFVVNDMVPATPDSISKLDVGTESISGPVSTGNTANTQNQATVSEKNPVIPSSTIIGSALSSVFSVIKNWTPLGKEPVASSNVTLSEAVTDPKDGITFYNYSNEKWASIAIDTKKLMDSDPDNYSFLIKCAFPTDKNPFYAWGRKPNMRTPVSRLKSTTALCDFTIPIDDKTVYECFFESHRPAANFVFSYKDPVTIFNIAAVSRESLNRLDTGIKSPPVPVSTGNTTNKQNQPTEADQKRMKKWQKEQNKLEAKKENEKNIKENCDVIKIFHYPKEEWEKWQKSNAFYMTAIGNRMQLIKCTTTYIPNKTFYTWADGLTGIQKSKRIKPNRFFDFTIPSYISHRDKLYRVYECFDTNHYPRGCFDAQKGSSDLEDVYSARNKDFIEVNVAVKNRLGSRAIGTSKGVMNDQTGIETFKHTHEEYVMFNESLYNFMMERNVLRQIVQCSIPSIPNKILYTWCSNNGVPTKMPKKTDNFADYLVYIKDDASRIYEVFKKTSSYVTLVKTASPVPLKDTYYDNAIPVAKK